MVSTSVTVAVIAVLGYYILNHALLPTYTTHQTGAIVVTGASTGIGRHAALSLAEQGFTVFFGVRKDIDGEDVLSEAKSKWNINPDNLVPVQIDVTKPDTVAATRKQVESWLSKTNKPFVALINNAGLSRMEPVEFHDLEDAKWVYEVNLIGLQRTTLAFLDLLKASKGRIINVSSVNGFLSTPFKGTYAASKFAVEALSDALRRELYRFGVAVSVIQPGYVLSAIHGKTTARGFSDEAIAQYSELGSVLQAKDAKELSRAPGPEVTSAAILDAVTKPTPRTRYPCAGAGGMSATQISYIAWMLPDYALDAVLRLF